VKCTEVAESTITFVAATPPMRTAEVPLRFVPVIVSTAPPPIGPDIDASEVMLGAGGFVIAAVGEEVAEAEP